MYTTAIITLTIYHLSDFISLVSGKHYYSPSWFDGQDQYSDSNCIRYCANGGTLNNDGNCKCLGCWSGDNCDESPCTNHNCGKKACSVNTETGEPVCSCPPGHFGDNCIESPCDGYNCGNGTCLINNEGFAQCGCPPGLHGTNCEISPCESHNCNNGQCCTDANGSPHCYCDDGHFGLNCDHNICDFVTCNGHGTCLPAGECSCDVPYSGTFCQDHPCDDIDCNGNGNCTVTDGGATECQCDEGYKGDNCEVPNCQYLNTTCHNRGTCNTTTGECECVEPYIGDTCQICNASKEVDVIFVVDETGSVELPNFKKTLIALNDTIAILDVGQDRVRVGLMTFNATPTLQFHLDMFDDKEELQNATLSIPYNGGSTSISRAIKYTRIEMLKEERGDRSHAHNRVVLLTDGISSVGGHPTIRKQKDLLEAQRLKDTGAVLICVGIGPEVDPNTLKQMASADDYFIHTTFDLLGGVLKTKINAVVNCKV